MQVVPGENTAACRKRMQRAKRTVPPGDRDNGAVEDAMPRQFRRRLKPCLVLKVTENDRLIAKQRGACRGAGTGRDLEATHNSGCPAHSGFDQKGITVGEQFLVEDSNGSEMIEPAAMNTGTGVITLVNPLTRAFSVANAGISKTRITAERIAPFMVFTLPSTGLKQ